MTNERQALMRLLCPPGADVIDGILEGYQRYQVLLAALDLRVFELLDERGASQYGEIAEAIGINEMFAREFLGILVDCGLLSLEGGQYRNTRLAADFLVPASLFYQGDVVRNIAGNSFWGELSGAMARREDSQGRRAASGGPKSGFVTALGQKALRGQLQAMTQAISGWRGFEKARRILDVGGGHGLHTIALCQANPRLEGVVLDQAGVVETTRRHIARHGLEHRVSAEVGDVSGGSLGAGYDIVLISHLLYRRHLAPVFDAVHASLNPGGVFISNHWFRAPGGEALEDMGAVKALSRAFQSFKHPLCPPEEFDALLDEKGFELVSTHSSVEGFGAVRLQLAEKR